MCAPSSTTSIAVSHSGHLRPAVWLLSNTYASVVRSRVHAFMWPCDCAVVWVVRMPSSLRECYYGTAVSRRCGAAVLWYCVSGLMSGDTSAFYISPYQYYPRVPPPSLIPEPNEAARAHECVAATKTNHPLVRIADDAQSQSLKLATLQRSPIRHHDGIGLKCRYALRRRSAAL